MRPHTVYARAGTNTAYRDGCRCLACGLAHSRANHDYESRKAAGVRLRRDRSPVPIESARYPHGTVSCYTTDRCGCPECREAWRNYHAESRARLATERFLMVPAIVVRAWVLRAGLRGYGKTRIARECAVDRQTVGNLASGRTKMVRSPTALKIVAGCRRILAGPPISGPVAGKAKRRAFERES